MKDSFENYMSKVADYIAMEYDDIQDTSLLTDDEKYTIKTIGTIHYECNDSINNTASYIMNYIKSSREWTKKNIKS